MASQAYRGKNFSIEISEDDQFVVSPDSTADETFDSFDELVEAHPCCEEAREFFFGAETDAE